LPTRQLPRPPRPTLYPYTTLFRSEAAQEAFEEDASDSLSWLQEEPATDEPAAPSRQMPEAEAFSWMQDYNLELSEEFSPSTPTEPEPAAEEEEMPDWLKDEGFLDEALGIE